MSAPSRVKPSPGLLVRALVALGGVAAIVAALATFASQGIPSGGDVTQEIVILVVVGALTRRYGIPLPGSGFASYILGVAVFATLDRGWAFCALVAPLTMIVGDIALRRLPLGTALDNRIVVLIVCAGVIALSYFVYRELGSEFLPEFDEGAFVLDYFTPAGTSLARKEPSDFALRR